MNAPLCILDNPPLKHTAMILSFSGWLDGGEVSTGTLEVFYEKLDARPLAKIDPADFYIYNVPGPMEISALFRPHVHLEKGLIKAYQPPNNIFFYDLTHNLIMFRGKEPNLQWHRYCDCLFTLAEMFDVRHMYFIGSVAGLVPHSREPRITGSFSSESLREAMTQLNFKPVDYEGPAGIVNQIMWQASQKNINMVSLVAEIPAYVQGRNPKCIEAVARRLARLLNIDLNLDDLHALSESLEKKLDQLVEDRPELADHVRLLEENYDQELFDNEMGDLKKWLLQQGIRLD